MEYILSLDTFSKTLEYKNRETIYKMATSIAGADGVIDEGEKVYLNAMKKSFGISVKASKEHGTFSDSNATKKETIDVKGELEKYKSMLDDGLISQEDYEAKKKELLDL